MELPMCQKPLTKQLYPFFRAGWDLGARLRGVRGLCVLTICRCWEQTTYTSMFLLFTTTNQITRLVLPLQVRSPPGVKTRECRGASVVNTTTSRSATQRMPDQQVIDDQRRRALRYSGPLGNRVVSLLFPLGQNHPVGSEYLCAAQDRNQRRGSFYVNGLGLQESSKRINDSISAVPIRQPF